MKAKPARVRVQLVEGGPFRLMTPAQAKRLTKAMRPRMESIELLITATWPQYNPPRNSLHRIAMCLPIPVKAGQTLTLRHRYILK